MYRVIYRVLSSVLITAIVLTLPSCMDTSLSQAGSAPAEINIQNAPEAIQEVEI